MAVRTILRKCQLPRCGITFETAAKSRKFCSRECGYASRRGEPGKTYRNVNDGGKERGAHVLRAEAALGHRMPPGAEVHHADGSKSEHAPLVICQDRAYHMLLHMRMRIKAAGGNPNTDAVCPHCLKALPLEEFCHHRNSRGHARNWICRSCYSVYQRVMRDRRLGQGASPENTERPS